MIRGMKLSFDAHSMYDHVFSWLAIVIACDVMDDACYTIFVQARLTMTMSIKVWKPFLTIRISIHYRVW
jgi:hypothetical protein